MNEVQFGGVPTSLQYMFVCSHSSASQCQQCAERCLHICLCVYGAQIFAIFETLPTLGNSRVTFQVHLNEKCVSGCCMNCYKTGVAYAHRRRTVGFVNGSSAAELELLCTGCNSIRLRAFRGRQLSFIGTTVTFAT